MEAIEENSPGLVGGGAGVAGGGEGGGGDDNIFYSEIVREKI